MPKAKRPEFVPTFEKDQMVRLRCEWFRPPYCREDWVRVRFGNGYGRFLRNDQVEFDGSHCWIRGKVVWHAEYGVEMKLVDCDGEGVLDAFPASRVRSEKES